MMLSVEVCHFDELKEGSTRELLLGEFPVLVGKSNGRLFGIGNKCSHFGLPMTEGHVTGDRIRCPFHGACFNVHSGDIEDSPGLDCLPTFSVTVRQPDQMILLEGSEPESFRRRRPTVTLQPKSDTRAIVIVGGGPSAEAAAETLRQEGFRGSVTLVSSDSRLPYDRTLLSKFMNKEPALLRDKEFFDEIGVECLLNTRVRSVSLSGHAVEAQTEKGAVMLNYTKLLVCSGLTPRRIQVSCPVPKCGIEYLYTSDDGQRVSKAAAGADVVVIGSSFVAMEAASFLLGNGGAKSVTVAMRQRVPFASTFGEEVGGFVRDLCESKGLAFAIGEVAEFESDASGRLTCVILNSGHRLPAQLCLVGIGAEPSTSFMPDQLLDSRGFVKVDEEFRSVCDPDVFAAGDVTGGGHWQTAQTSGRLAARAILGHSVAGKMPRATFFWTGVFAKWMRYVSVLGRPKWTRNVLLGSYEEQKFMVYFVDEEDRVVGGCSLGMAAEPTELADMLADRGGPVPLSEVRAVSHS